MKRLLLLAVVGFAAAGCFKSDLDGKVVQPKPWGPPGGAAKFKPGAARGAPAASSDAKTS